MLTMNAKDTVSAALAECYVTIGDKRYNFMQAINLEAKFEREKSRVPILGRTGRGNKTSGWKGTGKAAFHYNPSIFRELMYRYKSTGDDVYFDSQVTNDDPTSSAGRQTVISLTRIAARSRSLHFTATPTGPPNSAAGYIQSMSAAGAAS